LLPQIRAKIREEFRTSSGPSDVGGNPPSVTIHTRLERFNKQKPHSFEKATAPTSTETSTEFMQHCLRLTGFLGAAAGTEEEQAKNFQWVANDARNYEILHERDDQDSESLDKRQGSGDRHQQTSQQSSHRSHGQNNDRHGSDRQFKKLFFLQFFPRAEQKRLKREYHSIRQTNTETSTEFMQRFLRLVSIDARNYEILHERDDDDAERPDKRQRSSDRHQPTSQQSSHRNHGHNNDRHGSDRRGGGDNHRSNNNRNFGNGRDQRNRGHQSNQSTNSGVVAMTTTEAATITTTTLAVTTGILAMDVTKETGVISLTDLPILALSNPGVPLRVTPIQFALLVVVDTKQSVVELHVYVSSVAKLAIYRKIAGRTPLRARL
nr:hypothetical protein [Tanacetum cinerariifolium]